jgi:hypothetical protein
VKSSQRMPSERLPARPNSDLPIAAPGAQPHTAQEPAGPTPLRDSEQTV